MNTNLQKQSLRNGFVFFLGRETRGAEAGKKVYANYVGKIEPYHRRRRTRCCRCSLLTFGGTCPNTYYDPRRRRRRDPRARVLNLTRALSTIIKKQKITVKK